MNGFAIALNVNLDYMSFPRSCARLYLKLDFATLSALRSTYLLQGASSRTNWPPSLCPPARLTVGQGRAREGGEGEGDDFDSVADWQPVSQASSAISVLCSVTPSK